MDDYRLFLVASKDLSKTSSLLQMMIDSGGDSYKFLFAQQLDQHKYGFPFSLEEIFRLLT